MIIMKSEEETGVSPLTRNCNSVVSIPMEISIAEASSTFPGFRFSPTDEELIQYYLKKKLEGCNEAVEVIAEVDICRHEPWDLPAQSIIHSENEWFYFSPRGRKYPNGSQSKRATESGYWKATGKERVIKSGSTIIGTKRTLVFHAGRAPRGQRTEWIMHEYTTSERSHDAMVVCRLRRNSEFHLHLHENARRTQDNPPRDGEPTPSNNGAINLSGGEVLDQGPKVADGNASKDYSSNSNTSHSVDQDFLEEEDFYADIMKDDIIKLDETPSTNAPISIMEHVSEMMLKQPDSSSSTSSSSQGTANRRLKLRTQVSNEELQIQKLDKETMPSKDGPKKTERKFSKRLAFVLVLLILLLLYVMLGLSSSSRSLLK